MPKTIYFGDDSSGIDVTWTKSTQRIYISGWFDGFVGIQGESLTLKEFFDRLEITEKDVKKVFKK